jgi:CheY-like chemotaxis protein
MILLVDDSAIIHELMHLICGGSGYSVLSAWSGKQAIQQLQRRACEIELILLDLQMPELDGCATLPLLRAVNPDVPIIIFTALDESDARRLLPTDLAVPILSKDCGRAVLLATIHEALTMGKG